MRFSRNSSRTSVPGVRILAVDPGLTRCGVGIIDAGPGRQAHLVDVLVLQTPAGADPTHRLRDLARGLTRALDEYRPDRVALERVFAQHNVRTVMGTAQVSGVLLALAGERGLEVALHTPSEVKAAVSGNGRATKQQVSYAVRQVLSMSDDRLLPDATDALALALCSAWRAPSSGPDTQGTTPAQQKWREAESRARRARRTT